MNQPSKLITSQLVNQVGQYLYKNIDGAYKAVRSPNTYEVYMMVLYQVPVLERIPGKQKEGYNDMHEMHLNINLTTYQNKLRVNIIEMSPEEVTLGHFVIPPEKIINMKQIRDVIYEKVVQFVCKRYKDYDFLF